MARNTKHAVVNVLLAMVKALAEATSNSGTSGKDVSMRIMQIFSR